jgi:branched-chain amino acid transport system substrate-binding protein
MSNIRDKVIFIIIGIVIGFGVYAAANINTATTTTSIDQSNQTIPDNMVSTPPSQQMQKDIDIGLLSTLTGDLSVHGTDIRIAAELAADDFNNHLETLGHDWRINLVVEDTQTDPIIALEKLQSLNSKGIKIVLGPPTSAEVRNIKGYVDSNNILLVSPSSTSSSLAIDDNIFRLISDDTKHSMVLAKLFHHNGVKAVIPMYRGDVWADGVYDKVGETFRELGGVYDEGIRYSPEATVFSTEVLVLSNKVTELLETYDKSEIAVLLISFSEAVHIMNSVNQYDDLKQIRWFGSEGSSNDDLIANDPTSAKFSQDVLFITPQNTVSESSKFYYVRDAIQSTTGSAPNIYAYSAYDSVWIVGQSILQTGSTDVDVLVDALPNVAHYHSGSIGHIVLNEAGDLAIFNYELWTIQDGEWIRYGRYDASQDTFVLF